jgi:cell division transport system ATP-binding protein
LFPGSPAICRQVAASRDVILFYAGGQLIEFRGVSKHYSARVHALTDVALEVAKGEFVFVVGPSGAGKSTLLRLVYREESPTSGRVIIDGRDVGALRPAAIPLLRRQIGVVFQDFKLLPRKTVFENVAFALEVTGVRPSEIRRRVGAVLDLVGLRNRHRAYPEELSGGEQQRTCLARALANSPKILLADEPTGNLDPETGTELMQALWDVSLMGTTVMVATHAHSIVDAFRCRVVRLEKGRLVRDDLRSGYWGPGGLKLTRDGARQV